MQKMAFSFIAIRPDNKIIQITLPSSCASNCICRRIMLAKNMAAHWEMSQTTLDVAVDVAVDVTRSIDIRRKLCKRTVVTGTSLQHT